MWHVCKQPDCNSSVMVATGLVHSSYQLSVVAWIFLPLPTDNNWLLISVEHTLDNSDSDNTCITAMGIIWYNNDDKTLTYN